MVKRIRIKSEIANLRIIEKAVDEITAQAKVSSNCYGKILVAVLEAVNNAIVHGNKSLPDKFVDVAMKYSDDTFTVIVKDEGPGFSPENVPDPTLPENIENVDGRGIFLMTKLSDEIEFNDKGNMVTFVFNNIAS